MNFCQRLVCCLVFVAMYTHSNGQSELERYQERFPKAPLVQILDERHLRIDIIDGTLEASNTVKEELLLLNKNAASFADRSIQYSDFFELVEIKAMTRVPDGRKYKNYSVKDFETAEVLSERNFYDGRKSTSFTYPNARPGAHLTLEYKEQLQDARFVNPYYFNSFYDTEMAIFEIDVDEDIELEMKTYNDPESKIRYETSSKKGRIYHKWTMESIPGFEPESSAPSFRSVSPTVAVRVKSYETNGESKAVLRDVSDLFSWYSTWIDSIKDGEINNEIKAVVDSIKQDSPTEKSLVNGIYDWVKSNIKYLAIENDMEGFIPRDPNTIYQQKFGDCKDMSCMLVNMMDHAGVESHFTWIGTRDIALSYEEFPAPFIDNHMIATYVTPEGDYWFLDATDEYLPLGYPSEFIQGKQALIYMSENDFKLKEVPAAPFHNSGLRDSSKLVIEKDQLRGQSQTEYRGYHHGKYRRQFAKMKGEDPVKFFKYYHERGNNKFQLTDYGKPSFGDSLTRLQFDYQIDDYISRTDDKIFVNLNLEKLFSDQKLDDDRTMPVKQDYAFEIIKHIELEIPNGYEVEYLPKDLDVSNELLNLNIKYSQDSTSVYYSFHFTNKSLMISPEQFESWNQMVKQVKKSYREVVTLKKKV